MSFQADASRRLAYYNLETRDYYFTRLKTKIEIYKKQNNQKIVLCSHSYIQMALFGNRADV
jgi:hypothetical protein